MKGLSSWRKNKRRIAAIQAKKAKIVKQPQPDAYAENAAVAAGKRERKHKFIVCQTTGRRFLYSGSESWGILKLFLQ
jgi:hypothetical protein